MEDVTPRFGNLYQTTDEMLDPQHTALVVVDLQNDFAHPEGSFGKDGKNVEPIAEIVPAVDDLIQYARRAGVLVVWIQQTTLKHGLSDSAAWYTFKTRDGKNPEYTLEGTWGQEIVEPLRPIAGEPIVQKFRSSAFVGTHLDQILRSNGIDTAVMCGCVTEGCVESTVRSASFYDYYTFLVEDGVASTNAANHEAAMVVMKSRYMVHPAEYFASVWAAKSLDTSGGSGVRAAESLA